MEEELERRVDELVSAASVNERRFLLRFASTFWDGEGDVFENGPLLGGTTRGLALGMLANPRRRRARCCTRSTGSTPTRAISRRCGIDR